jgi:tetratricopeptide (TPR) repeat protein
MSKFRALLPILQRHHWLIAGVFLGIYTWLSYRRYFSPFSLIIHLVVLAVISAWASWKVLRRERLVLSPLTWPMVAFLGSVTVSTFLSMDMRRSFDMLLTSTALVLFFFLFCDLLRIGWKRQSFISLILCTATFLMGIGVWETLAHYWSWWQLRTLDYPTFPITFRLFNVTDHPNVLAGLLNLALPFAIIRLATSQSRWERGWWVSWLLVFDLMLVFTRSRGGMVAAMAVIGVTVFGLMLYRGGAPSPADILNMKAWSRKRVGGWLRNTSRIWGTTLVYVALFVFFKNAGALWTMFFETYQQTGFSTNAGDTISKALTGHRMVFWGVAWEMFLNHPLVGSGPLTFGHHFVEELPAVRFWSLNHAHSLYVETLATQGIVGIAALGWMILAGAVAFMRTLIVSTPSPHVDTTTWGEHHLIIIAVCGGLAGYLTHALVDLPGTVIRTIDLFIMLSCALGMHAAGVLHLPPRPMLSRWTGLVMAIPVVLLVVFIRFNAAQEATMRGILYAMDGEWQDAARSMEEAVAADPSFGFYHGQRAYAYSVVASPIVGPDDPNARQRSLESYRTAFVLEPPYVPHLLNAAWLLYKEDNEITRVNADELLTTAANLRQAEIWALPHLLLGERYAQQGDEEQAKRSFAAGFAAEPHGYAMAACRQSDACRNAATSLPITRTTAMELHAELWPSLVAETPSHALTLLQRIPMASTDPLPWLDRANAHIALGEYRQAEYALQVAHIMSSNKPSFHLTAYQALTKAALARARGETTKAIEALETAAKPRLSREGYGYGTYRRVRLPGDLQPQLDLLQRTADDLAVFEQLATLYEQQGRAEEAMWARTTAEQLTLLLGSD